MPKKDKDKGREGSRRRKISSTHNESEYSDNHGRPEAPNHESMCRPLVQQKSDHHSHHHHHHSDEKNGKKHERKKSNTSTGSRKSSTSKPPVSPPSSSNIELLSPKQNGSTSVESDGKNKASIKGMWKKAFKSLKSKDKDKDEKSDKGEKGEGKYSRLQRGASFLGFGGHSHDSTKSHHDSHSTIPESPEVVQGADGQAHKESRFRKYSRQSSLKRVLKRKDSKEAASDSEPAVEGGNADPVFSTLRQAMSMRRHPRSDSRSDYDSTLDLDVDKSPDVYPSNSSYYGQ